jgi:iron complex outermembrane recepter protein
MSRNSLLRFAIAAALLPGAAFAQSAGTSTAPQSTENEGGLQEVIVTAERREGSLQETPLAVTALTAETIEDRQVTEARDLARYAPSLKMFNNITSPTNLSPSLRGSLQQDASLIVAESPFGIYVDDVYIARLNGNNVTLADIEGVEVLRGPQGTLYGRNTLVGAIKFKSRDPGADPWLNASVGAGNFDQYRGSVSWGTPLGESWAASLSGLVTNKDGQFRNVNVANAKDTGLERSWAARAKLAYIGSDVFKLVFSVSHSDSKNDAAQLIPAITPAVPANQQFTSDDLVPLFGTYQLSTPIAARGPDPIAAEPQGQTEQTIGSITASVDFGWGTFKSITGYVKTKDFFSTDFSGSGRVFGANRADVDQFSEELQLLGAAFGDRLNYLVGVYYFQEEGDQRFGWNLSLPPFIPTAVPFSSSTIDMDTKSYSAFTQLDYNITDDLKVTAGVRYTKDEKEFDFNFVGLVPFVTAQNTVDLPLQENEYTQTTPKFGIDYKLPSSDAFDSLLLYATWAKGFKSGGYNGIAIFNANDARTPYGAETNRTTEVGIKADLLDNRLRVNANYFYSQVDDLTLNATVTIPGTPPITTFPVQNAGDAKIKGLEFEITAVPTDGFTMFASGSVLDGEYGRLDPTSAPANAMANFGVEATPPQLPKYTVTLGFDYGVDTRAGRVKVGADWYFQDDYVTSATNDFKVKAYNVGNAFVGLELDDNWELRAAVKNLSDNNTITTGSRGFLGGFIPLRPREYLFSVNYKM